MGVLGIIASRLSGEGGNRSFVCEIALALLLRCFLYETGIGSTELVLPPPPCNEAVPFRYGVGGRETCTSCISKK